MIPTERLIDCYLGRRSRQLQRGQPAMVPTLASISSEPGECARLSVLVRESDQLELPHVPSRSPDRWIAPSAPSLA